MILQIAAPSHVVKITGKYEWAAIDLISGELCKLEELNATDTDMEMEYILKARRKIEWLKESEM
jgi:hypothetical protein